MTWTTKYLQLIFKSKASFKTFHSTRLTRISQAVVYWENKFWEIHPWSKNLDTYLLLRLSLQSAVETCLWASPSSKTHGVYALSSSTSHIQLVPIVIGRLLWLTKRVTSDYRRYYPSGLFKGILPVPRHVGETSVKLCCYDVIIWHIWTTYPRFIAFSHSVCASH